MKPKYLPILPMTVQEILDQLKWKQGDRSLRTFAEEIGVTAAYLSDVYRGNREPAKTILAYLNIEKTVTRTVVYRKLDVSGTKKEPHPSRRTP